MSPMRLRHVVAGQVFLRVLRHFACLARVPVVGPLLRALSRAALPVQSRVWVQIRRGPAEGLWIRVNPRTGGDLYEGTRERLVQEALRAHLAPGMVLYDLGANIGLFTLIGARCVGRRGRVYAFEPDPEVCERLRENVRRNGLANVEVIEAAVGARTGSTDFLRADPAVSPDLGLGRVGVGMSEAGTIRVRSVALDDLQDRLVPDVVKCDVEGAEVDVIAGARSLLQQRKPVVICEVHSTDGAQHVERFLLQCGYAVRWVDTDHVVAVP